MRKVLILVVSSQKKPYRVMVDTALDTWDKVEVDGVETIYYFGEPVKDNASKFIYFPIREGYDTMGYKMLDAFEWVLKNKEFDYIARVNSSCYVDKKELKKFIETLPTEMVFAGVEVKDETKWCWGGCQFILSKDVVKMVVENKDKWNHSVMEDMALSHVVNQIGIEYTKGRSASIDKMVDGWRVLCYNGNQECFIFNDFKDLRNLNNQFFYRVKQDGNRDVDAYLMKQLYEVLA